MNKTYQAAVEKDVAEKMKKGNVSLIIENHKGEILLMLRDNKPTIPFPNHWSTIGGVIEPGETPKEAAVREAKEELDYDFRDIEFIKHYSLDGLEYNLFRVIGDFRLNNFRLNEGQKLDFFSEEQVTKLNLSFRFKEVLADYFKITRRN